jgi:hypothetical protein
MVVPRAPNTASPSSRVRTSTSLLSRSTRSRSAVASPTPPPRSRRAGWFSGALRKLWSSESLSVTRCMSEQANAERCLSLDRRLGRRSRNGRVRRGVRRHRLYPRPFSHLTTWRPWSVTHGADMSRAGVVLEAARDITVRGESPAHRPSGRPRISSRARPPCRRPGAGWPERPMPRRGQSSPGLVRVGIVGNALHRHLLARLSGRKDAGRRDGFIEPRTSAWPHADPLLVTIGPVATFLAATRCRAGFRPPATFVRDTFLPWRPSCRAVGPGRRWT